MKLHMLSGGRLRMRRWIYYPGADKAETFELPVVCALLKHPQGNVLYDTGCHPDAATDPEGRWGNTARYATPIFQPEDAVIHQLPKAGLTADDIDVVICSHLHIDHCGCNAFFRKATIVCHAAELAAAEAENAESMGYMRQDWDHGQPFRTIETQHDLFGARPHAGLGLGPCGAGQGRPVPPRLRRHPPPGLPGSALRSEEQLGRRQVDERLPGGRAAAERRRDRSLRT
jgi:glyoxylase-like metal-dependent hydrolase (beta-lactamase superfamily II)